MVRYDVRWVEMLEKVVRLVFDEKVPDTFSEKFVKYLATK